MSTNSHRVGAVHGSVSYATHTDDRRLFHYEYAPHGTEETNVEFVEHVVEIVDVRRLSRPLRLEVEGAGVFRHRSDLRCFYDEEELRRVGYPETAELVRSLTGAADVVVFDHNIRGRSDRAKAPTAVDVRPPVFQIHTDFTGKSAEARAAAVLGTGPVAGRRIIAINVWRPLVAPLRDCPLAICDASSVDRRDLLATDLLYPDRTGQIYYVAFNPAHRWYYASDMQTDEVWVFKNYDSAAYGRVQSTPHTAFVDPTHRPADQSAHQPTIAARESVEFRAFAFFND
jgi:hypothetical protein